MDFSGSKLVLTVLGVALCGTWAGNRIRSQIAAGIKDQLPTMIGPAERYDVKVSAGLGKILNSRLDRVRIHADSVDIRNKLEAQSLDVDMQGVRFDRHSRTFKGADHAQAHASIRSIQLQRYLTRKYSDISDIQCQLKPNRFYLSAKPSILGLSIPVDCEGTLKISGTDSISAELSKVTAAGVKAPEFVTRFLTNRFNPVFQLSEVGLNAHITSLSVSEDQADIEAELDMRSALTSP